MEDQRTDGVNFSFCKIEIGKIEIGSMSRQWVLLGCLKSAMLRAPSETLNGDHSYSLEAIQDIDSDEGIVFGRIVRRTKIFESGDEGSVEREYGFALSLATGVMLYVPPPIEDTDTIDFGLILLTLLCGWDSVPARKFYTSVNAGNEFAVSTILQNIPFWSDVDLDGSHQLYEARKKLWAAEPTFSKRVSLAYDLLRGGMDYNKELLVECCERSEGMACCKVPALPLSDLLPRYVMERLTAASERQTEARDGSSWDIFENEKF